ncbi:hypothetical protein RHGRI_006398 [Rhododendron griersonianum]|uniref:Uncharacterized protein n=1 Tax=Rhododendron griersonianum TaxID=479676 RepID=A0AAV6KTZ4_9ERIC|nr:hypothetical protein RHGRI_006398 [Rhododendron griersonianum]
MVRSVIPGQYDGFLVVLRMCHKLRKLVDHGGSEADDDVNKVKLGIVRCAFTVSRGEFLAEEKLRDLIYESLPLAYVRDDSGKESIVGEAHRFGRSMDSSLERLPPFLVDVGISMLQLPGDSEDEGIARAIEEMNVWDLVPATRASIEALKEVAFDSRWSVAECRRCSKSLAEGKLAVRTVAHML